MPLISSGDNTANAFSLFNSSNAFRACDVETKHTPHSPICKSAIHVFTGTDQPSCNKFSCFESGGLRVFFTAVHPASCGATGVGARFGEDFGGLFCFCFAFAVRFESGETRTCEATGNASELDTLRTGDDPELDNNDERAPERSNSNSCGNNCRSVFVKFESRVARLFAENKGRRTRG